MAYVIHKYFQEGLSSFYHNMFTRKGDLKVGVGSLLYGFLIDCV